MLYMACCEGLHLIQDCCRLGTLAGLSIPPGRLLPAHELPRALTHCIRCRAEYRAFPAARNLPPPDLTFSASRRAVCTSLAEAIPSSISREGRPCSTKLSL